MTRLTACFMLVIATFLIRPFPSAAESDTNALTGVVRNSENGDPLPRVSVRIIGGRRAITDGEGRFRIENPGEGTREWRASRIGYTPAAGTLAPGERHMVIMLAPAPVQADEVIATARGRETPIRDVPGSAAVVTGEEIEERGPATIPEALARFPGIAVSSDMPWSGQAVIRGLSRDQVVLLVDGARISTNTTNPAQFGTVPPGDIERIEVLKGPLSVLYGSGSTGGIVNVITRGGFDPERGASFLLAPSYESGASGLSGYARASWSGSRFHVGISQANRAYGDIRAGGGLRIRNSQFRDRQGAISLGVRLGSHTIEGRWQRFVASDVGIPGGASFPETARASYPETTRALYDLSWTWRPAAGWLDEVSVKGYAQPVERNVEIVLNPHVALYPGADHKMGGGRFQVVLTPGRHRVVAGIEGWEKHMVSWRRQYVDGVLAKKDTPVPDSRQRPVGLFAEDAFPLAKGALDVTLGARYDLIHTENGPSRVTDFPATDAVMWNAASDDDASGSAVAGAVWHARPRLDISVALARSFRSPTIEERYLFADLGGVLTVGDPAIDSEYGTFAELGLTRTGGAVRTDLRAYVNRISDMVVRRPAAMGDTFNGEPVDYRYRNAGIALFRGFEASAAWAAIPSVLVTADAAYVRGTDEREGTDLPAMPPARGHLSIRWDTGSGLWVEPVAVIAAGQGRTAPGEVSTDGYALLDIGAGMPLPSHALDVSLAVGVRNVFDTRYRDHLTVSRGYEQYSMGRSIYAGLIVSEP